MTDIEVHEATAVIDNGKFGSRTIRFETGRLARQAAGSVVAYLDDDTMLRADGVYTPVARVGLRTSARH